ncbi:hypothetical protein B5G34_00085 [Flavonifractor sp. An82]|nr:hypothetical protein B5G34_00085 [Flavonifractor sp. An82]
MDLDQQDDAKLLYKVSDLKKIFGIKSELVYKLVKLNGFPTIRINGRYYFPKDQLKEWIEANINKDIDI